MKVKLYPALAAIAIVAISLFFACRKSDLQKKPAENFDVAAAKEWWYGTFRKTAEYKKTDWTSPLAPPETFSTKKYPSWKRAISYKRGTIQIIELPLVYETNSILLPGMQGLNGTKEGERIARSAIHKLVIIKQQNGTVSVRTVTIVPMPEYAKAHQYDMSHITMEKLPTDFNGYLMVGSWDASEKNIIKMGGGKPARKVKLKKKAQLPVSGNSLSTEVEVCDWVPVPHMVWVCVVVPTGDDLADEETCQENGQWVEQGTDWEWQCTIEENDPYEDLNECINNGMPEEDCVCMVFNMGCDIDDPGEGGGEGDPTDPENDLALPCENPVDHSGMDTIETNNQRIKDAFAKILPPEYGPFIQFDQNGVLNKTMLLSAQNSSGIPQSTIFNALVVCINSNFNIDLSIQSSWQGMISPDSTLNNYSWESSQQSIYGITVMPGAIPTVTGVPVTGNPTDAWIFIRRGEESSDNRLAFLIAHELLGHLYSFIQNNQYIHGDPSFESWVNKIEAESQKNWKMIKK